MSASWQRIELWLAEHAPDQLKSLAKGATGDQIKKLEAQLKVSLPEQYRGSCAIHDGQKEELSDLIPDGYGTFYLLRLKDIPREWRLWNKLNEQGEFEDAQATSDRGVASVWWNRGWIPFASNGGGDHLCLDLAPARGGNVGQVIKVEHDNEHRALLAPFFAAWLHHLANSLKNGELDLFLDQATV